MPEEYHHLHGTRREPQTVYALPFVWWWTAYRTMELIRALGNAPRRSSQ